MLENIQAIRAAVEEIPMTAPDYPKEWLSLPDAPRVLYALGNRALLTKRKMTVVGSRRTPPNALKLGAEICAALSERFVLVTGTADGGDSAAIEGSLKASGEIICLLAGGFSALPQAQLNVLESVLQKGLILAVHPFETSVRSFSYEYRNKLLAYLCEGVFVLGAGEKSGALITAKYAERAKLPVFALPYPPNSLAGVGCNRLIKRGGYLTESAEDIFGYFGIEQSAKRVEVALTPDEERVYVILREVGQAHANELAAQAGVPAFKIRAILSALEVKGKIVNLGGNRYASV